MPRPEIHHHAGIGGTRRDGADQQLGRDGCQIFNAGDRVGWGGEKRHRTAAVARHLPACRIRTSDIKAPDIPEQIAGILAWKARAMLAISRMPAERKKLHALSRDIVCMYHDSHRGAGDLSLLLERFALAAR